MIQELYRYLTDEEKAQYINATTSEDYTLLRGKAALESITKEEQAKLDKYRGEADAITSAALGRFFASFKDNPEDLILKGFEQDLKEYTRKDYEGIFIKSYMPTLSERLPEAENLIRLSGETAGKALDLLMTGEGVDEYLDLLGSGSRAGFVEYLHATFLVFPYYTAAAKEYGLDAEKLYNAFEDIIDAWACEQYKEDGEQLEISFLASRQTDRHYMTKNRAAARQVLSNVPNKLALLSTKDFKLSLLPQLPNKDQTSYIMRLQNIANLKDCIGPQGQINIDHENVSLIRPEEMNPVIQQFFSIVYNNFLETGQMYDTYDIYLPDLARKATNSNIGAASLQNIVNNLLSVEDHVGVFENVETGKKSIWKLLTLLGYNEETKVATVAAPYLLQLINKAYQANIISRKGDTKLLPNGLFETKAFISKIAELSLTGEKNIPALEIVYNVIVLVEQGSKNPHISTKTLLEYSPTLYNKINKTTTTREKNIYLKRAFKRALEILNEGANEEEKDRTGLRKTYEGISIPEVSPENIPTIKTLSSIVWKFPYTKKNTSTAPSQKRE